jgi:hypothetical protein
MSLDLDSDYGEKTLGFDVRLKQTIPPENYILANNSFIYIYKLYKYIYCEIKKHN